MAGARICLLPRLVQENHALIFDDVTEGNVLSWRPPSGCPIITNCLVVLKNRHSQPTVMPCSGWSSRLVYVSLSQVCGIVLSISESRDRA